MPFTKISMSIHCVLVISFMSRRNRNYRSWTQYNSKTAFIFSFFSSLIHRAERNLISGYGSYETTLMIIDFSECSIQYIDNSIKSKSLKKRQRWFVYTHLPLTYAYISMFGVLVMITAFDSH